MAAHTKIDLYQMQSLPLDAKIRMTARRIDAFIDRNDAYLSISGGKDSRVLDDIERRFVRAKLPRVFIDTGLEHRSVRACGKKHADIILRPEKNFKQIITEYGYPVISKEVAQTIAEARKGLKNGNCYTYRMAKLNGTAVDKNGDKSKYNIPKYKFLLDAPFRISHKCCDYMKKKPAKQYEKETGRLPIVATMAEESNLRLQKWLKHGCNAFDLKRPMSAPMSFWSENDVLEYLFKYELDYAECYGKIIPKLDKEQIEGQITIYEAKLKPEIEGSALKSLEKTLQHKPNYFMDTTKFIKRLATYVAVEHTAFIIPIEDEYGRLCGWYPLRAQRCEVVEATGQVYLRYLFANGEHGAIEFERVGIMTDFEYTDDLFGEDNRTLKPTMQLIHTQNEGIINAVKNSANIRFLAKVANMLKPEDIKKERQRFTEDNLTADNDSGMIIYDNKFSELKQVESKPYTPNALQMQNIQENVCTHFGTNMDILQNKFDENTWNAYYEGKIEPFAIQLSLVMTNMSFTERERACGNAIFFSANRLQYASNATKLSVSTQLFDRALLNRNGVMDIWNMAHVEDGEKYYIRKEYTEVSELQNSNGKPQIIIQQAPIATGQQAEPQQTPPAAAGEPAGGLGEKEGVNNAD